MAHSRGVEPKFVPQRGQHVLPAANRFQRHDLQTAARTRQNIEFFCQRSSPQRARTRVQALLDGVRLAEVALADGAHQEPVDALQDDFDLPHSV